MNLKTKLCATGVTLATTAALGLVPAAAASAAPSAAPVAAPAAPAPSPTAIASSTINQATPLGQFAGTFTPIRFVSQRGQLGVTGVVAGTITNAAGVVTPVSQVVTTTVQSAATAGSCDILNLVLGPLHLNVLGLVVDLNQVVLNITGQTGAGNLLGNLLCGIAGLLDGNGLSGLTALLNRLLGL